MSKGSSDIVSLNVGGQHTAKEPEIVTSYPRTFVSTEASPQDVEPRTDRAATSIASQAAQSSASGSAGLVAYAKKFRKSFRPQSCNSYQQETPPSIMSTSNVMPSPSQSPDLSVARSRSSSNSLLSNRYHQAAATNSSSSTNGGIAMGLVSKISRHASSGGKFELFKNHSSVSSGKCNSRHKVPKQQSSDKKTKDYSVTDYAAVNELKKECPRAVASTSYEAEGSGGSVCMASSSTSNGPSEEERNTTLTAKPKESHAPKQVEDVYNANSINDNASVHTDFFSAPCAKGQTHVEEEEIQKPVTLMASHQNWLLVAYHNTIGLYLMWEPLGWQLMWLSGTLDRAVDRVAITSSLSSPGIPMGGNASSVVSLSTGPPLPTASGGGMAAAGQVNNNSATIPFPQMPSSSAFSASTNSSSGLAGGISASGAAHAVSSGSASMHHQAHQANGSASAATNSPPISSGSAASVVGPTSNGQFSPPVPPATSSAGGPTASQSNAGQHASAVGGGSGSFDCLFAVSCGAAVVLWGIILRPNATATNASASNARIPSEDVLTRSRTGTLPQESSTVDVLQLGKYNLNHRSVDHLFFVGCHLVALSRKGLVGVRHVMTNSWQVWSTVPILSYGVVGEELLLLGGADGCISSINIQKFPLRIVDNVLLVTLMYRDPFGDPVTSLSIYVTPCGASYSSRYWLEIAYGTLSGRVCVIVQRPETQGCSPLLLQSFHAHRSMVTRVQLSERHLTAMCVAGGHVRTWAVNRFRGMISTQATATPLASFHVVALDSDDAGTVVVEATRRAALKTTAGRRCASSDGLQSNRGGQGKHSSESPFNTNNRCSHEANGDVRMDENDGSLVRLRNNSRERRDGFYQLSASVEPGGDQVVEDSSRRPQASSSRYHHPQASNTTNQMSSNAEMTHTADLPRTSWLHEDACLSQRSSVRTSYNSNQCCQSANHLQCGSIAGPDDARGSFATDTWCCSSTEASGGCPRQPSSAATTDAGRGCQNGKCSGQAVSSGTMTERSEAHRPLISAHRHGNAPGPYGDRDDHQLFIQKLTPQSTQLFVRLASNGKRVCVINALDKLPITTFCVHSNDTANRLSTRAQRFVLTGHPDGTIQIWDLSTALGGIKATILPDDYLTTPALYANSSLHSTAGYYYGTGGLGTTVAGGVGAVSHQASQPLLQGALIPVAHDTSGAGHRSVLGGPNAHEMLRLLESCHLSSR